MRKKFGNCIDCRKILGDYYSSRCKVCSNRVTSKKKIGIHLRPETRKKISESIKSYLSKNPANCGFKKGHKLNVGRKHSKERNKKISGENHYNWKGGVTPEMVKLRHSQEYKLWRRAVFKRDDYACVICGVSGSKTRLNADHIKPFATYPELRFAIDNGRTLCIPCHEKTESYKNRFLCERRS